MRAKFKLILLLAVFFLSSIVATKITASSEYDWKMVRDEDGIQIYLKEFWADEIKSFRGIIHINSSVDSLLAVILDIDACPDWVHHCKKPLLLARKSFSECYHYQIHHLPFPATNREFILHSKISRSVQTGSVSIHMKVVPEFCQDNTQLCSPIAKTALVRVEHSHGDYLLEAINNERTRVTWTQHTDPGGNLPIWLINSLVEEVPYRTLQGLRKLVLNSKYQKAKMVTNSQGKIINLSTSYKSPEPEP